MKNHEKIEFGSWVKAEREKKGLNRAELAQAIGVSAGSISVIENGKARSIGRKMVAKLKNYFAGENVTVLSHNSHSHINLGDTIQTKTHAHITRYTDKVLEIVSSVAAKEDFSDRVAKITEALECTKEEAVLTIFINETKKHKA